MGKGKPRHNPEKPQNTWGKHCQHADDSKAGEHCDLVLDWGVTDDNGKLLCKGNRHYCLSQQLKFKASIKEKDEN